MSDEKTGIELWRAWTDLWAGRLELAEEIVADGFTVHVATDRDLSAVNDGPSVRAWVAALNTVFTQAQFTMEAGPIAADGLVAGRWRTHGVLGKDTPFGPAGARFSRVSHDILRIDGDGRIAEFWSASDPVVLLG
ncbi:hypothetical protein [Streptomyces sp. NPDC050560]|uniref:hypothetical protein n=1 Tax=Streptomyces sp. NPDC050560 TaxID=3365630 RepID=UPI00379777FE